MITVEGLTKRYASHVAVDNISFSVERGQIVGFLGPNGAGKTTTMRVLTCFLPPTSGTARVAEFDVLEQPMEVKKRIGYLPETPPLYPEMEVIEYLEYVGRLKGVPKESLARRVDEAVEKCSVGDVKSKLIGKLSKGYRQRVGLAQAIIHNPDVLILDEPTSGLDPQQIIETRDLIKGLAGDHTIILSTHILPEVEQLCQRVIIIAKGKLVATDTVQNLTSRLRGAETVAIEITGRNGAGLSTPDVLARLARVAGVSRVLERDSRDGSWTLMVDSEQGQHIRPELARAVVEAGWNLNELHAVGLSLEEIFLELTGAPKADVAARHHSRRLCGRQRMNTLTILRKELNSYFRSPIAYGVMFFFAVISGYFFYVYTVSFVQYSIQSSMTGQSAPMSVNDQMIRPLLSNLAVIGLFFIPIITMRLFAEEKRSGTFELLATSPVHDMEIILGKWLAAVVLYAAMLGISFVSMATLFAYGKPDWRPLLVGYLGLLLQGGCLLAIGTYISSCTRNQIVAAVGTFSVLLMLWVIDWVGSFQDTPLAKATAYLSVTQHFDSFSKGVLDSKDVLYYASMIFIGLFLTARSLESLRWRA